MNNYSSAKKKRVKGEANRRKKRGPKKAGRFLQGIYAYLALPELGAFTGSSFQLTAEREHHVAVWAQTLYSGAWHSSGARPHSPQSQTVALAAMCCGNRVPISPQQSLARKYSATARVRAVVAGGTDCFSSFPVSLAHPPLPLLSLRCPRALNGDSGLLALLLKKILGLVLSETFFRRPCGTCKANDDSNARKQC